MKNISLCFVILPLLIISCTADSIDAIDRSENKVITKKSEKSTRREQNVTPDNPANDYDMVGKLHNELLDTYFAGNYQYSTIPQISEQIEVITAANNNPALLNLGTNIPLNLEEMQAIVNNPEATLEQIIANSSMTTDAKISLSSFMDAIILWKNEEYGTIYQSIISFESSVINNSQFNIEDKRIILTSSSIVRHSLYYAKERKDKDWETSVGNRIGGVSGAIDQSLTSVKKALIIGISQNNVVTD
jgi:hypothetical protein